METPRQHDYRTRVKALLDRNRRLWPGAPLWSLYRKISQTALRTQRVQQFYCLLSRWDVYRKDFQIARSEISRLKPAIDTSLCHTSSWSTSKTMEVLLLLFIWRNRPWLLVWARAFALQCTWQGSRKSPPSGRSRNLIANLISFWDKPFPRSSTASF